MAAGVPASHAIFLVVAVVASAAVGAAMIGIAFNLAGELESNSERLSEVLSSDIRIINDPQEMRYEGGFLYLYVLNTGDTSLDDDSLWIVIIDGTHVPPTSLSILNPDGPGPVMPGRVAELRVGYQLSSGDHSVKALYGGLAEDRMSFRIW